MAVDGLMVVGWQRMRWRGDRNILRGRSSSRGEWLRVLLMKVVLMLMLVMMICVGVLQTKVGHRILHQHGVAHAAHTRRPFARSAVHGLVEAVSTEDATTVSTVQLLFTVHATTKHTRSRGEVRLTLVACLEHTHTHALTHEKIDKF